MKASQTRRKARELLKELPGKWQLFLVPILSPFVSIILLFLSLFFISRSVSVLPIGFLSLAFIILLFLPSLFLTSASYAVLDVIRKKRERVQFNDNMIVFSDGLLPKFIFLAIWQTILILLWGLLVFIGYFITIFSAIYVAESSSAVAVIPTFIGVISIIVGYVMLIIKPYSYAMSTYILYDEVQNGTYTNSRAIIKKSVEMMKGNKWRYFCLEFSFIGWSYLTLLTFGLLYFYVLPYMTTATLFFYDDLVEKTKEVEEMVEEVNENE